MKRLVLHIGVHKTGTTHLQAVFNKNRKSLIKNNVAVTRHATFRKDVLEPMMQEKPGYENAWAEILKSRSERADTILISDENFPGVINNLRKGTLYPDTRRNLTRFLNLIQPEVSVEIYVSIRNYADWIESAYLQSIRRRETAEFEDYIKLLDLTAVSWVEFLNEILAASPKASVVLWPYEWYRENNDALVDFLEGQLGALPIRIDEKIHPSYSELALKILRAAEGLIRDDDRPFLQDFLRSHFTENQGYSRPVLFQAQMREQLTQKYNEDLKIIAEMAGPRLQLLGSEVPV